MAQKKLLLMISSRSDEGFIDRGDGTKMPLREARVALKKELEGAEFLGTQLLQVWINEDETGDGDGTAWQECVERAKDCDLFISLYDGSPGWTGDGGGIGICQAEFDAAFNTAPGKLKIIRLPDAKVAAGDDVGMRYVDALAKAKRFEFHVKTDFNELREAVRKVVRELLLKAANEGARQYRRSGGSLGFALDWSRMDFSERAAAIRAEIGKEIQKSKLSKHNTWPDAVLREFKEGTTLFVCHGAARALSMPTARELLGKPFLRDHQIVDQLTDMGISGPIHLIGCPGGATEGQAVSLLGAPDVFTVKASFGVYAVDRLSKIQICLLSDCADPGSTRNSVLRFLEWLEQSGEVKAMVARAKARRRIVEAILMEAE